MAAGEYEYRHLAAPNSSHMKFCWNIVNSRPVINLPALNNNASLKTGVEMGNLVRKVKIVGDDTLYSTGYGLTI